MPFQDNAVNSLYFVVVILLAGFSRSQEKCHRFKSVNSSNQELPVFQSNKTEVYKLWRAGRFGSLQCCASSNPQPTISWFKNGQRIDLSIYRLRLMDENQTLWISGLRVSDSGNYTCQARNARGQASRHFKVDVKLTIPHQQPIVDLKANSWNPMAGSDVTLECVILKSASKPTVFWFYQKNINSRKRFVRKDARHTKTRVKKTEKEQTWSSKVFITNVTEGDEGLYTCEARLNGLKPATDSRNLTLYYQEPIVNLRSSFWYPLIGSNVTLECLVQKSLQKPSLAWFYQKNVSITPQLLHGSTRQEITVIKAPKEQSWFSRLLIRNVTMDDDGVYICEVQNGRAAANDSGILAVTEIDEQTDGGVGSKNPPKHGRQNLTWAESTYATVATVLGVVGILIVVGFLLWRRRHRAGSPGNGNKGTDPPPENKVLLPNGSSIDYNIPSAESLQLLGRGADNPQLDFDVFVSYSSHDRDFVKNSLYAELVNTHAVCIDFKDFEVGIYIGDNIMNSIFRSRKTLLVVTQNFLKGDWTFFEMQIAQGRLAQGHDVLIPVIVDNIPYDELPKPLQHYRQTKTYLEFYNEDVKPHFWDRLRNALGPTLHVVPGNPVGTPESTEEESAV